MVGIDKIQLWSPLNAFSVNDANRTIFGYNLSTKQGNPRLPYLLTDNQGFQVYADSIYHNSTLAQYSINQRGLLVQFNPSKRFHPYHLTSTGPEFSDTVQQVAREMMSLGFSLPIEAMRLVRVDLARQCEMSSPFPNYVDAFRMLKAKRAKNQYEYPSGYVVGNTQWETISYDKECQLTEQQHMKISEHNLMRVETRWLNAKTVETQLGVSRITALSEISPDELRNLYVAHLNNRIFPKQFEQENYNFHFDTEVEKMRFLHEQFGSNWIYRYIAVVSKGVEYVLIGFGGIENMRKAMLEFLPKQTVSDQIKKVKELISLKSALDAHVGEASASSMLFELQNRFAA